MGVTQVLRLTNGAFTGVTPAETRRRETSGLMGIGLGEMDRVGLADLGSPRKRRHLLSRLSQGPGG